MGSEGIDEGRKKHESRAVYFKWTESKADKSRRKMGCDRGPVRHIDG